MLIRTLGLLLLVSNVLTALAPDFAVMLMARAMLGLCIGGFFVLDGYPALLGKRFDAS